MGPLFHCVPTIKATQDWNLDVFEVLEVSSVNRFGFKRGFMANTTLYEEGVGLTARVVDSGVQSQGGR